MTKSTMSQSDKCRTKSDFFEQTMLSYTLPLNFRTASYPKINRYVQESKPISVAKSNYATQTKSITLSMTLAFRFIYTFSYSEGSVVCINVHIIRIRITFRIISPLIHFESKLKFTVQQDTHFMLERPSKCRTVLLIAGRLVCVI